MKVALCYDRVSKFGGAERVLAALHDLWPDAPLFTLNYDKQHATWAHGWDVRTSFLDTIPFLKKRHELFPPLAAVGWEQFSFHGYDVVISITSAEAKSIIVPPNTLHICYCLTPTRYYWSGYYDYLSQPGLGKLSRLVRKVFPILASVLRVQDFIHAQRPHELVAISEEVRERIEKYYRRPSLKIYPPVNIPPIDIQERIEKEYFLVVSRLVPYKRIDIVVDAFNALGWPLVIVGTGSEKNRLLQKAAKNIHFVGFVSDEELATYYAKAVAVVFPTHEDFGIVPLEAQAHGVPVVALKAGGVLETVIDDKTGVFFEEQNTDSLVAKLRSLPVDATWESIKAYFNGFTAQECRAQAERFSSAHFKALFASMVEEKHAHFLKKTL